MDWRKSPGTVCKAGRRGWGGTQENQIKEAEKDGEVSQEAWKVNKEPMWKQEPKTESILRTNAYIKTTVRYQFTLNRMAIIFKKAERKISLGENVEKIHCW